MSLPGSAPVLANSPKMFEAARLGPAIVEMIAEDLAERHPHAGAFHNAVVAVLAVSGSINCIKHCRPPRPKAGSTSTSSSCSTNWAKRSPY